ncbi:hypothetical protein ACWDTT_14885 [Streptosporangium sandarakinum]|jgi:hypothetical protein|uniref:Uncharacterized protein n=2 Tax=Staphylococcus TaxID=1279 RepID=A0A9X4L904_9STAP|nr:MULTISPECIES: hypothetical protein [Staphylococcus]EJD99995.1 hypothetical protein HMPREF9986_06106 [Staphylococcus epidermidis NIHLM040]DAS97139.1 MAG TPA: hypothetical protein [Caudoviricetes sp.]MBC3168080.1 hypothetical protein [Staphylococcus epidermidis]MBM5862233.1 hypothetical protein [Staphylococcus epidermidis]MBM6266345.1 hypothetical protein [Staphylococcus epidermidis]
MSKEVSIRYLQDRDGEEYFPVTHIEAVIGLGVYLDKIENLKKENEELKKRISHLEKE